MLNNPNLSENEMRALGLEPNQKPVFASVRGIPVTPKDKGFTVVRLTSELMKIKEPKAKPGAWTHFYNCEDLDGLPGIIGLNAKTMHNVEWLECRRKDNLAVMAIFFAEGVGGLITQ